MFEGLSISMNQHTFASCWMSSNDFFSICKDRFGVICTQLIFLQYMFNFEQEKDVESKGMGQADSGLTAILNTGSSIYTLCFRDALALKWSDVI